MTGKKWGSTNGQQKKVRPTVRGVYISSLGSWVWKNEGVYILLLRKNSPHRPPNYYQVSKTEGKTKTHNHGICVSANTKEDKEDKEKEFLEPIRYKVGPGVLTEEPRETPLPLIYWLYRNDDKQLRIDKCHTKAWGFFLVKRIYKLKQSRKGMRYLR